MLKIAAILAVTTAVFTLTGGSCNPTPGAGGQPTTGFYGAEEAAITLTYFNRRFNKCPSSVMDNDLRDVARAHSKDLAEHHAQLEIPNDPEHKLKENGHLGSDGSRAWEMNGDLGRIRKALPHYGFSAENVYWKSGKPDGSNTDAWNWWLGSESHRNTIDNCRITHHGIGVYYNAATDRTYYTHDFAA